MGSALPRPSHWRQEAGRESQRAAAAGLGAAAGPAEPQAGRTRGLASSVQEGAQPCGPSDRSPEGPVLDADSRNLEVMTDVV